MAEFALAQSFSMIALNAQRSSHKSVVKQVALRVLAAAVVLECYLNGKLRAADQGEGELELELKSLPAGPKISEPGVSEAGIEAYQNGVINWLQGSKPGRHGQLCWWLKRASSLPQRKLMRLEQVMTRSLMDLGAMEEIPHLLGCDMYFESSGVAVKEYRSELSEYTRIAEGLRAEVLENGPVSDETICLLWLLRESGCLPDLFSGQELAQVALRINELDTSSPIAHTLFWMRIGLGWGMMVKHFLRWKKAFVQTAVGKGMLFLFPLLERSQAVFIETEAWFANSQDRLGAVKQRLETQGHVFTVVREGEIPTIKIDNLMYEAVPHLVTMRVPIQGVRLIPKRPL
ncbi:hypothetical protein [Paenibacillus sanguinis]|uniref:hypothetical protein n=1 Tax=Paenibacillus sanguinis TaxID=225906 RepID=UPI000365AF87|nr:hypothetical protein [Paenibacillus sanguinis]